MLRLVLLFVLFLLSLLCIFKAPEYHLWYVSILAGEFSWVFATITALLLLWGFKVQRFGLAGTLFGLLALVLFMIPIVGAYRIGSKLAADMDTAFPTTKDHDQLNTFSATHLLTNLFAKQEVYMTMAYSAAGDRPLTLDLYRAKANGPRPCVVVVHGGSWSAGDSHQLPDLNSLLVKQGYNVASINYRLAPKYISPAPVADLQAALSYLRTHAAEFGIDTNNFVLLGRSAGGQIVLNAAYALHDPAIKGVINYYGPTDMVWGYAHPANPMVLDTKKVMEDYLGGTYASVPKAYDSSSATVTAERTSVPTLTVHGMNDPLVAYEHATRLENRLKELGVPHYTLSLPWATHGCDYSLASPSGQLATYAVLRFLKVVAMQ